MLMTFLLLWHHFQAYATRTPCQWPCVGPQGRTQHGSSNPAAKTLKARDAWLFLLGKRRQPWARPKCCTVCTRKANAWHMRQDLMDRRQAIAPLASRERQALRTARSRVRTK